MSIETVSSVETELKQGKEAFKEIKGDNEGISQETAGLRPLYWAGLSVVIVALSGGALVLLRNRD